MGERNSARGHARVASADARHHVSTPASFHLPAHPAPRLPTLLSANLSPFPSSLPPGRAAAAAVSRRRGGMPSAGARELPGREGSVTGGAGEVAGIRRSATPRLPSPISRATCTPSAPSSTATSSSAKARTRTPCKPFRAASGLLLAASAVCIRVRACSLRCACSALDDQCCGRHGCVFCWLAGGWVLQHDALVCMCTRTHTNTHIHTQTHTYTHRLMYVHAYQSFIWNHMVGARSVLDLGLSVDG